MVEGGRQNSVDLLVAGILATPSCADVDLRCLHQALALMCWIYVGVEDGDDHVPCLSVILLKLYELQLT